MSAAALGILALIAVFAAAGAAEKYEEKFAKTEAWPGTARSPINNLSGSIKVRSWDQAKVKIEADKVSNSSTLDKAKANAALVTIEVDQGQATS